MIQLYPTQTKITLALEKLANINSQPSPLHPEKHANLTWKEWEQREVRVSRRHF